jgi:dienelactone hydrolase
MLDANAVTDRSAAAVSTARRTGARLRQMAPIAALISLIGCGAIIERVGSMGRWGWEPSTRVSRLDTAFLSDGHRIEVERFAPIALGSMGARGSHARHPAILVLHASGGLLARGGATVREWADAFAEHGYVAFVVHYFDRTDDVRSDDAYEDATFPEWTATLHDAVSFVRSDHHVDSTRVYAFGVSLGGFMALALGAEDRRVSRLVVLSGGFFDALAPTVHHLPPTLLMHGDSDDIVPLAEARRVDSTLARLGVPHALVVYPGASHTLDDTLEPDALRRSLRFLDARTSVEGVTRALAASTAREMLRGAVPRVPALRARPQRAVPIPRA